MDISRISTAGGIARLVHKGQVDKSGNDYYDSHIYPIFENMLNNGYDEDTVIVALLHDTIEDTALEVDSIRQIFGDRVAEAVDAVTRRNGETYHEYLGRCGDNKIAKRVKFYDMQNNLSPLRMKLLDQETRERLKKKYKEGMQVLQGDK